MTTSVRVLGRDCCACPDPTLKRGVRVGIRKCGVSLRLSAPSKEKEVCWGSKGKADTVRVEPPRRKELLVKRLRWKRWRKWRPCQGKPLAPYNTTQFLMSDHGLEYKGEFKPSVRLRKKEPSVSLEEEEEDDDSLKSSPSDDEFTSSFNAEWLNKMSQAELVLECTELNRRIELMEEQVSNMRCGKIPMSPLQTKKMMLIRREIHTVLEENKHLCQALDLLCQAQLPGSSDTQINSASSDSGIETTFEESCVWH
ncbi:unnamed protein product [Notodromas monacha]|uniref:Uncharacterized protein n=1 Tax=Notodromas monacha TaxID=399045 RepID=A0A7R9GCT0_9CRUS|nr:unnamed protein product [Notodromas monacha]CAG0917976.1 unnamed protein product [Notodromas monacha]